MSLKYTEVLGENRLTEASGFQVPTIECLEDGLWDWHR